MISARDELQSCYLVRYEDTLEGITFQHTSASLAMIIVDTLFEHYEVDENTIMSDTPHDLLRKNAIAAMHSTENTQERVTTRALELCPLDGAHTFGNWEDACIRSLLELHNQSKQPAAATVVVIQEALTAGMNGTIAQGQDHYDGHLQVAVTLSKEVIQAPERPSSGSLTAVSLPSSVGRR